MIRLTFAAVFILTFSGCQRIDSELPRPDLSQRKARILATTGMIADLAQQIGGDCIEVECLIGQQDPHSFIPVAGDRDRLESADLILYNGLHLEGKMADLFEEMRHRIRTVPVAEAIPEDRLRRVDGELAHDPHVWFDVQLWILVLDRTRDALIDLDPIHRTAYEQNAERYRKQLEQLDAEIREKIQQIPQKKRILITAHDAFGYFGRTYGLEVHGLQGVSTATDVSSQDVRNLAKLIGENQIPTIFAETSVPDRSLQAVQQAVRNDWKVQVQLSPKKLFSDALGEPGTTEGTYLGMVRYNVNTIVEALK